MTQPTAAKLIQDEVLPRLEAQAVQLEKQGQQLAQVRAIFNLNGEYLVTAPQVLAAQKVWNDLATRSQLHDTREAEKAIAHRYYFGWLGALWAATTKRRVLGALAAVVGTVSTFFWAIQGAMTVARTFGFIH